MLISSFLQLTCSFFRDRWASQRQSQRSMSIRIPVSACWALAVVRCPTIVLKTRQGAVMLKDRKGKQDRKAVVSEEIRNCKVQTRRRRKGEHYTGAYNSFATCRVSAPTSYLQTCALSTRGALAAHAGYPTSSKRKRACLMNHYKLVACAIVCKHKGRVRLSPALCEHLHRAEEALVECCT